MSKLIAFAASLFLTTSAFAEGYFASNGRVMTVQTSIENGEFISLSSADPFASYGEILIENVVIAEISPPRSPYSCVGWRVRGVCTFSSYGSYMIRYKKSPKGLRVAIIEIQKGGEERVLDDFIVQTRSKTLEVEVFGQDIAVQMYK
jgi:hypothetical protein